MWPLRRQRKIRSLPIELTGDDLQHVGSKAVIDSRPPSIRQYALYSHRLSNGMRLTRDASGRERLGGWEVTVHTQQTVPARYRDRFDAADPPCRHGGGEYISFRGLIIEGMAGLSSRLVPSRSWRPPSAECRRICALIAQQPLLWGGCRTIDSIYGDSRRFVLHGDEEGDEFAAYIETFKGRNGSAYISLWTTEAPKQGGSGPAAFPRGMAIARNKMDGPSLALLPTI
ncbi:unnamed protein product [Vitrella brassicaformis CCMP3155]|uniref:Uncharacterized protein n=1 Tax=Vitrella brassicaformis (strain CCMP3155) TaxID=1169540 RepID=A0A0G4FQZ6_VITBC|nr:unnamed protein product [Vitrella brassicaformis CCMP3155]|eukprot:CEM16497.1 unnamed protein product [Vitrella brassicaformis CCMP3155]